MLEDSQFSRLHLGEVNRVHPCVCAEGLKRGLRRHLLKLVLGSDIHSELVFLEVERMDRQFTYMG